MSAEAIARLLVVARRPTGGAMSGCEKHVPCDCNECSTFRRGIARGVADERARVVADLRARAGKALTFAATRMLQGEADRIERGEHEEAT